MLAAVQCKHFLFFCHMLALATWLLLDRSSILEDVNFMAKELEVAARCRITFADGAWQVPSQSGNGKYKVVLSRKATPAPATISA
jgi:hypothetical protein